MKKIGLEGEMVLLYFPGRKPGNPNRSGFQPTEVSYINTSLENPNP